MTTRLDALKARVAAVSLHVGVRYTWKTEDIERLVAVVEAVLNVNVFGEK